MRMVNACRRSGLRFRQTDRSKYYFSRASQKFISWSDHAPEVVEAVRCVEPDVTSFDAEQCHTASGSFTVGVLYSRRRLRSTGLRLIELQAVQRIFVVAQSYLRTPRRSCAFIRIFYFLTSRLNRIRCRIR